MKQLEILLVEDSPGDERLIREALRETGVNVALQVARDGWESLEYLHEAERGTRQRPDLVLLDWNLPGVNGSQVLAEVKSSAALRQIPVLVLTSSTANEDIQTAYSLNANSYLTKPGDLNQYISMVRAIEAFWFYTATLPGSVPMRPAA